MRRAGALGDPGPRLEPTGVVCLSLAGGEVEHLHAARKRGVPGMHLGIVVLHAPWQVHSLRPAFQRLKVCHLPPCHAHSMTKRFKCDFSWAHAARNALAGMSAR